MAFLPVAERCMLFLEEQSSDALSGNCQSGRQAVVNGASILLKSIRPDRGSSAPMSEQIS